MGLRVFLRNSPFFGRIEELFGASFLRIEVWTGGRGREQISRYLDVSAHERLGTQTVWAHAILSFLGHREPQVRPVRQVLNSFSKCGGVLRWNEPDFAIRKIGAKASAV